MNVPIVGIVGLAALVWKVTDFIRYAANYRTSRSSLITQLVSWTGGVVAVLVYAATDYANTVTIGAVRLDHASVISRILIGVVLGSMASTAVDLKQAIDGNDSAAKPSIINDTSPQP